MSTSCRRGGTSNLISSASARESRGAVFPVAASVSGVSGGGWKGDVERLGLKTVVKSVMSGEVMLSAALRGFWVEVGESVRRR